MSAAFTFVDGVIPKRSTTIDILSFDVGEINMGVARLRYDYESKSVCMLNGMLLNIFHPLQRLNENDAAALAMPKQVATPRKKATTEKPAARRRKRSQDAVFSVASFYAEPILESKICELNHQFSQSQHCSRKRARIVENTEEALQFATNLHPQNVAKRRNTRLESKELSAKLETSWPLVFAQLPLAFDAHEWISDISNLDFILVEQQMSENALIKGIFASTIMYFEMKRSLQPLRVQDERNTNWHLKPFIKAMSASKKLAQVTQSLHESWTLNEPSEKNQFMSQVQIRALLKEHFKPAASLTNTESYGQRKISSKKEVTHFFCSRVIQRARQLCEAEGSAVLPDVCPERIVEKLAREPVNNYAYWIVNQLKEKNNVTDAILQAFAWINECLPPENEQ